MEPHGWVLRPYSYSPALLRGTAIPDAERISIHVRVVIAKSPRVFLHDTLERGPSLDNVGTFCSSTTTYPSQAKPSPRPPPSRAQAKPSPIPIAKTFPPLPPSKVPPRFPHPNSSLFPHPLAKTNTQSVRSIATDRFPPPLLLPCCPLPYSLPSPHPPNHAPASHRTALIARPAPRTSRWPCGAAAGDRWGCPPWRVAVGRLRQMWPAAHFGNRGGYKLRDAGCATLAASAKVPVLARPNPCPSHPCCVLRAACCSVRRGMWRYDCLLCMAGFVNVVSTDRVGALTESQLGLASTPPHGSHYVAKVAVGSTKNHQNSVRYMQMECREFPFQSSFTLPS